MFSLIKCPICGGKQKEKVDHRKEGSYLTHTQCVECKQYSYKYSYQRAQHIETIMNTTYVLSESLPEDEYEQIEMEITSAVLSAQKIYYKEQSNVLS